MRSLWGAIAVVLLLLGVSSAFAATYHLKPGDTLSVNVWQDPKLNAQVVVGPDGMISFPLAGHLVAAGQTLQAVEAALRDKLKSNYNTPLDVTVSLVAAAADQATQQINEPMVYITGEVNKPGAYPLGIRGLNALQVIALSGGFSPFAATSRIVINRHYHGLDQQFVFNYRDFELGRDPSGNIDLRAGDVVVVPEKGLFGH